MVFYVVSIWSCIICKSCLCPRHEDVQGEVLIFKLVIRWKWVDVTPRLLLSLQGPQRLLNKRLVGLPSGCNIVSCFVLWNSRLVSQTGHNEIWCSNGDGGEWDVTSCHQENRCRSFGVECCVHVHRIWQSQKGECCTLNMQAVCYTFQELWVLYPEDGGSRLLRTWTFDTP